VYVSDAGISTPLPLPGEHSGKRTLALCVGHGPGKSKDCRMVASKIYTIMPPQIKNNAYCKKKKIRI